MWLIGCHFLLVENKFAMSWCDQLTLSLRKESTVKDCDMFTYQMLIMSRWHASICVSFAREGYESLTIVQEDCFCDQLLLNTFLISTGAHGLMDKASDF